MKKISIRFISFICICIMSIIYYIILDWASMDSNDVLLLHFIVLTFVGIVAIMLVNFHPRFLLEEEV